MNQMPDLECVTRNFLEASLRELKKDGCLEGRAPSKVEVMFMKEFEDLYSFLVANYQIDKKLFIFGQYSGPMDTFFELHASQLLERYIARHGSWEAKSITSGVLWYPLLDLNEYAFSLVFEKFREFMCSESLRIVITAPLINFEFGPD